MDCGQNGSMLKSLQFTKVKGEVMDIFELAKVDKEKVVNLDLKLTDAEDLKDFTKDDFDLVNKCAGMDLMSNSMLRTFSMLAAQKLKEAA